VRLTQLTANNVKRIEAITITPDGNMVVIGGKNRQGKSSALDCIQYALSGKRAIPDKPLRRGAEKGSIELRLDGDDAKQLSPLIVTRTFEKDGKSELEIREDNEYQSKAPSPQKILDGLWSRIAFDPLGFTRMPPAEQHDLLRKVVGVDTDALDLKRVTIYDLRREINRHVQDLNAQIGERFPSAPEKPVSVAALMADLKSAEAVIESNRQARDSLDTAVWAHSKMCDRATEIESQIARLQSELASLQKEMLSEQAGIDALQADLALLVDPDLSIIRERITGAEETNRQVRCNDEYIASRNSRDKAKEQSDLFTKQIAECDAEKIAALASAKWPVEGLAFSDDGITLNGLPFEQASQSEQLQVSIAMGIATNPTLRVLLIRDGSHLDEDALRTVGELADEHDCQVFIERVGEGKECSVIIEDGKVKS